MSNKAGTEQCPACAKKGGDNSQDNLVCYSDGSKYCYACKFYILANGVGRMSYELPLSVRFSESGLSKKKISRKTLERYGVLRLVELESDGTPKTEPIEGGHQYKGSNVVGFPFFDIESGALLGCKFRRFGGQKKDIWIQGDTKRMTFFGINAIPNSSKTAVLCEGETDTLSVAEIHPEYAALGIPGADTAEKCIKGALHVLKTFNRIILCFDNDEAGNKARDTALSLLPPGKTYVANLPSDVKDINELLVSDRKDDIKRVLRDCKQVTPKGVVDSDELRSRVLDYLFNRDAARGASTGFASIDKATGGAAPGKLITIAGGTGSGKSTLAEAIAVNAATISGTKTFFIPLEMTDSQVGARMVQQILREPVASEPDFKINSIPRLDIERAIDIVQNCIRFFDHYGSIDIRSLIETCEYAIDAFDVRLIVLDHITAAASGSEGLDWKALDAASSELKQLAIRRGVCIVIVSHISRDGDNEDEVPKLRHIRGGNGLAQYSDCVLGIGRKRDSKVLNVRTIKVDRMVGKFVEFQLQYDRYALIETGEVTEVEQNEEEEDDGIEENGWYQVDEVRTVPLDIRGDSSDELPSEDGVRTDRVDVPEDLHTGLSSTEERDTGGDEGLLPTGRQNEDEASESFKPRARYTLTVPTDSIEGSA